MALGEDLVFVHVAHGEGQHEIDLARDRQALHDFGRPQHRALEKVQLVGALAFQRHQHDHHDPPPHGGRVHDGNVAQHRAGLAQPLHPAQAGHRRQVHALRDLLAGALVVFLHALQNLEIEIV
ncbi:hypothetical protein D9M70_585160 [compost metagenome]